MFEYCKNKKNLIIVAVMLCVISFGSINIASADSNERWFWLTSNDYLSVYVDKETIRVDKNNGIIDVYLKFVYPSEHRFDIVKTSIDYRYWTINYIEGDRYTDDMKFIETRSGTGVDYITPQTNAEIWAIKILQIAPR